MRAWVLATVAAVALSACSVSFDAELSVDGKSVDDVGKDLAKLVEGAEQKIRDTDITLPDISLDGLNVSADELARDAEQWANKAKESLGPWVSTDAVVQESRRIDGVDVVVLRLTRTLEDGNKVESDVRYIIVSPDDNIAGVDAGVYRATPEDVTAGKVPAPLVKLLQKG